MSSDFDYIVRGSNAEEARYLIILIHGYGRNAHVMDKPATTIARAVPNAHILIPHAPELLDLTEHEMQALPVPQVLRADEGDSRHNRRQWFGLRGDLSDLRTRLLGVAGHMNGFIDIQRDRLGIPDERIAIMGFSQGGGVALCTAYLRAQPVACVVGHSTMFLGLDGLSTKSPTLYIYGTQDEEFELPIYNESTKRLAACVKDLTVNAIVGLGHRTNDVSRLVCANYVARHLKR